ncbi:DUF6232 family protein [Brenneria goodwinii]|uniref:DUF6232 family protein n=1 Tax=Brenneria goodwinii TaxID=1109412 RepID=UPI0036E1AA3A
MDEVEFYNNENVSVTNARFRVGENTYAMNGVTSVKRGKTNPSKAGAVILGIIGVLMVLSGSVSVKIIGGIMLIVAVLWFKAIKPEYIVFLNSSSGESQALSSKNEKYINDVINALNESIVHRG